MKKPVIVISSHVARGSIGNRAAVFALEVSGHPVWAVPTIILPYHPGHGTGARIIPNIDEFTQLLSDLAQSAWLGEVGAVLTGYMSNPEQAEAVAEFISTIRNKKPDIIHVCDPVMGDGGNLYVTKQTAEAIKAHLVQAADIITPNLFEWSWLNGVELGDVQSAISATRQFFKSRQPAELLITSVPGFMRGNIGNLLIDGETCHFAEHREIQNAPNGPGDLTAALFLSHVIAGETPQVALQKTSASVFEIVAGAARHGADELMLETDARSITQPNALVQMRDLSHMQE